MPEKTVDGTISKQALGEFLGRRSLEVMRDVADLSLRSLDEGETEELITAISKLTGEADLIKALSETFLQEGTEHARV